MQMNFSDSELEALLSDIESDRAERKESWSGDAPDRARQAVCAFANDLPDHKLPGVLFIGAKDNGTPSGLQITDQLLLTLSDIKTDGQMLPPPTITVQKRRLKNADMAVVIVQAADAPPVRYKGRIWVRIGPRRSLATAQDERILNERRRHRDTPYDIKPFYDAKLQELNKLLFEEEYLPSAFAPDVLAKDDRSYEQRLAACKMIVSADEPIPTFLGLVVLGKDTRRWIPGAYIQFLRIDGIKWSDPIIDESLIEGTLSAVVKQIDEKLKAHNRVRVDITQLVEKRSYIFPIVALQQIVRNTIMHRTYEGTNAPVHVYWFNDRIEIMSPGGTYGAVNAETFGKPGYVDYRNPHLADAMKVLGFVQRFGVGIQTAREALKQNENPPAIFELAPTLVKCIIRVPKTKPNTPVISVNYSGHVQKKAESGLESPTQSSTQSTDPVTKLVMVLKASELSASELRDKLKIKHRHTFRTNYLRPALENGLIEQTLPDKPNSRLQKYRLTEKGCKMVEGKK